MAISPQERARRDAFLERVKTEVLANLGRYSPSGKDHWRVVRIQGDVTLGVDVLASGSLPRVQVHLLTYGPLPEAWRGFARRDALPDELRGYGITPGLEDSGKVRYLGVEWLRRSPAYTEDFELVTVFSRWLASVVHSPQQGNGPVERVVHLPSPAEIKVPFSDVDASDELSEWREPTQAAAVRTHYDLLRARVMEAWDASDRSPALLRVTTWMLNQIVWGYTTLTDEAKLDLRFVTSGAKTVLESLQRARRERRYGAAWQEHGRTLRHEHVHTRKWVVQRLLEGATLADLQPDACLITEEEHTRLGRVTTGWDRYAAAGIRVWDRSRGSWR